MTAGFPNLFMITGPGSPSVLSNMMVSIEQHVDWIADCLAHLRDAAACATIEPTDSRRGRLGDARQRLRRHHAATRRANSWYMGANVPGKPRVFLPYVGGVGRLPQDLRRGGGAQDYLGFRRSGPAACSATTA